VHSGSDLKVLFIAGFGPIVRDPGESRELYGNALGIPLKQETDGYLHTETISGQRLLPCGRFLGPHGRVLGQTAGLRTPFLSRRRGLSSTSTMSKTRQPSSNREGTQCLLRKKGTMGTNRQPFHLAGRNAGWHLFHSSPAGSDVGINKLLPRPAAPGERLTHASLIELMRNILQAQLKCSTKGPLLRYVCVYDNSHEFNRIGCSLRTFFRGAVSACRRRSVNSGQEWVRF
jgi:hypothetical protein